MPYFTVLGSGSSGNVACLETDQHCFLIDAGLGPQVVQSRLRMIGRSLDQVSGVFLTHVHSDHWKERTLEQLRANHVPLWCHQQHAEFLASSSKAFGTMKSAGLVHLYESNSSFQCAPDLEVLPIKVPHDSKPTCAFRFNGSPTLSEGAWSLGYIADLGHVPHQLIKIFKDVEVLALEFNHDVQMEENSQRPSYLIERVLGDQGHLSNQQAAAMLEEIVRHSNNLKHLVQLHLSRQCNSVTLAQKSAQAVLKRLDRKVALQTAFQDQSSPRFAFKNECQD